MKYSYVICYVVVTLAALLSLTCDNGTTVSNNTNFPAISEPLKKNIPDSLLTLYQEDAHRLAVRYMLQTNDARVDIPPELSVSLFNGLIHIYNFEGLAERDTIVSLYPIHAFPSPNLHEIIVIVNPTYAWVQHWKNKEKFTGNANIDTLMQRYDLTVRDYSGIPQGSEWAVLRSSRPLNVQQLVERFKGIPGVVTPEPNGSCCDGNDIKATNGPNVWQFSFILGWGDCPSGCISRRFWDFRVSTDGTVEFLGSRGNPVPSGGLR
jgi:hypothetical protein